MYIRHAVDVTSGFDFVVLRHVDPDSDDEDDEVKDERSHNPRQLRSRLAGEVKQRGERSEHQRPKNVAMNAGLMIARSID